MSKIPLGTPGHVYVMVTDSHPYVKIGATTLHPEVRAFQLTCATASPHPFKVLHSREVSDCNAAEAALHEQFRERRVNDGREFFSIEPDEAALALDDLCGDRVYVAAEPQTMAELYATFPDDDTGRPLDAREQLLCRAMEAKLAGRSGSKRG